MKYIISDYRNEKLYDEKVFKNKGDALDYLKNLFDFFRVNGLDLCSGEGDSTYTTYKFIGGIKIIFKKV